MQKLYKEYLFTRHVLVNDEGPEEKPFETALALASLLSIRVTKGEELVHSHMIRFAQEQLGVSVPEPFYRGFPQSVRELTADQKLFDQCVHYAVTYGFGNFSAPGHSLLEETLERAAFREDAETRRFEAVSEETAVQLIRDAVRDLAASTRALDEKKFELVKTYVQENGTQGLVFASKNTQVRLLCALRDLSLAEGLSLADVMKVTEEIQWEEYQSADVRKLNWKNRDRKFVTAVIRGRIRAAQGNWRECFEKQAKWAGLLHHIHFEAKTEAETAFCSAMRSGRNESAYSEFEKKLQEAQPAEAARVLSREKGSGAVIRQMNYLLSRGASVDELAPYLKRCGSVMLVQLLMQYAGYRAFRPRTFVFTRLRLLRQHKETKEEQDRRRSYVPAGSRDALCRMIRSELAGRWKGKLGTVYVGPEMDKTALPVSESSSQSGFGVLPKGTRLPLPEGKKLRVFTYWEKVNDIDLSAIGLDGQERPYEFSWRSMAGVDSKAIVYSGDQTSGFHGGSEYFDIDWDAFREEYPQVKALIFCDNIFSRNVTYADCVCRAGYMLRDSVDSGEVFEPKTVASAFTVNCRSTFAYLFGLDLEKKEFVWLNSGVNGSAPVAGDTDVSHLLRVFEAAEVLSLGDMLRLMAEKVTEDPLEADLIASDGELPAKEGAARLHRYDIDAMLKLIETK